jgi:hypothetical protein
VILTADCDLEKGKGGPSLIYVPIVGLRTYLADVWLPTQAAALYEQGAKRLENLLYELDGNRITMRHVIRMSTDEVEAQLAASNPGDDKTRKSHIKRIMALKHALVDLGELQVPIKPTAVGELSQILDRFFPHQELIENPNKPGPANRRGLLYGSLCNLAQDDRVDTWPISDLIDLDPEMREEEHFGLNDVPKILAGNLRPPSPG